MTTARSYELLRAACARISFRHFPLLDWVTPYQIDETVGLRFILNIVERTTGEPRKFMHAMEVAGVEDEAEAVRRIRNTALRVLAHELDEALHLDGVRVFDPHDPQGAQPDAREEATRL